MVKDMQDRNRDSDMQRPQQVEGSNQRHDQVAEMDKHCMNLVH